MGLLDLPENQVHTIIHGKVQLQVRSERAVLPAGYEERVDTQLRQAAALMSSENYQDAQSLLLSVMSGEEDVMNQVITCKSHIITQTLPECMSGLVPGNSVPFSRLDSLLAPA